MEPNQELNPTPPQYYPHPFTRVIEFKDGTIINARGSGNEVAGEMWIWMDDPMSFSDAVSFFSDPGKTDLITIKYGPQDTREYEHYTILKDIQEREDGKKNIRLKKR